jgi:hypothetical protein
MVPFPLNAWASCRLPGVKGIDIPPPRKVRCVFLERTHTSTLTTGELCIREVVLVGYHTDLLWNEGWVVHELPGDLFTPQSQETLVALGRTSEITPYSCPATVFCVNYRCSE